jgi:hypothetical protein
VTIGSFRNQFDELFESHSPDSQKDCREVWLKFARFLFQEPENWKSEEVAINLGDTTGKEVKLPTKEPSLFQVYFGRLIDANPGMAWKTVEINFYFRYEKNDRLNQWLHSMSLQEKEIYINLAEGPKVIKSKREELIRYADAQTALWDELSRLQPVAEDHYFYVW